MKTTVSKRLHSAAAREYDLAQPEIDNLVWQQVQSPTQRALAGVSMHRYYYGLGEAGQTQATIAGELHLRLMRRYQASLLDNLYPERPL